MIVMKCFMEWIWKLFGKYFPKEKKIELFNVIVIF